MANFLKILESTETQTVFEMDNIVVTFFKSSRHRKESRHLCKNISILCKYEHANGHTYVNPWNQWDQ